MATLVPDCQVLIGDLEYDAQSNTGESIHSLVISDVVWPVPSDSQEICRGKPRRLILDIGEIGCRGKCCAHIELVSVLGDQKYRFFRGWLLVLQERHKLSPHLH